MAEVNQRFPFQKLDIYGCARELAVAVAEARIRHAELRDQAERAAMSAFLTLAEGLPNERPAMRSKYFTESNNSLHEVVAAVDLPSALAAIDQSSLTRIENLAFRFRGMLIKLHGR